MAVADVASTALAISWTLTLATLTSVAWFFFL
jgi:hypothetical protein